MNQYQIKFKSGNSSIITMNVKAEKWQQVIEKVEENFNITEVKSIKLDIPHVEKSGDLFNQTEQTDKQSNSKTKSNEKA